jgi:hypothetical protein
LVTAVHAHPAGAVTLADPVPPLAPTELLDGDTEYVHGAAA